MDKKRISKKKFVLKLALLSFMFAALLGALGVVIAGPNMFLFHPVPGIQITPKDVGIDYEDRMIETEEGLKINAWYFPSDKKACDILYLHGNSGNMTVSQRQIMPLIKEGYSVLAIDYRGFGRSDGKVDIDGIVMDALKAKETLTKPVIVFGQSMGGFTALRLAKRSPENIKGTIIDGGFADLRPLVADKAGRIAGIRFFKNQLASLFPDRRVTMENIRMPLLFIAGEKDGIVPEEHTLNAFKAAAGAPKKYIRLKGTGHVKSTAHAESREAIFAFIEENCK